MRVEIDNGGRVLTSSLVSHPLPLTTTGSTLTTPGKSSHITQHLARNAYDLGLDGRNDKFKRPVSFGPSRPTTSSNSNAGSRPPPPSPTAVVEVSGENRPLGQVVRSRTVVIVDSLPPSSPVSSDFSTVSGSSSFSPVSGSLPRRLVPE